MHDELGALTFKPYFLFSLPHICLSVRLSTGHQSRRFVQEYHEYGSFPPAPFQSDASLGFSPLHIQFSIRTKEHRTGREKWVPVSIHSPRISRRNPGVLFPVPSLLFPRLWHSLVTNPLASQVSVSNVAADHIPAHDFVPHIIQADCSLTRFHPRMPFRNFAVNPN